MRPWSHHFDKTPQRGFLVIKLMHLWSLSHLLTIPYISPHRGVFLHISTGESLMIIPNHFSQIPDYPKISPAGAFTLYGRMMCYIHYWVPKINYPQSQVDHYTIMSQRPLNSDLSPYWTSRYHVENNLWIAQIPQWSIILSSLTVGIRPLSP
jgi:hypothetical protein